MTKKRIERPEADEQDDAPIGYENVEPEVVEDEPFNLSLDGGAPTLEGIREFRQSLDVITKPGGEAVTLDTPSDETTYRVTFALPYGVLVALLDQDHADADIDAALRYGVLSEMSGLDGHHYISEMGELVRDGFDKIDVGHKMAATWRATHNRGVGGV